MGKSGASCATQCWGCRRIQKTLAGLLDFFTEWKLCYRPWLQTVAATRGWTKERVRRFSHRPMTGKEWGLPALLG